MSKQIYLKLDDIPIHRSFSQGHESDTVLDCPTLIPLNTFISKDKTFVGRWVPILYERYPCHPAVIASNFSKLNRTMILVVGWARGPMGTLVF
jgi:hypothetical protein